jgi:alpha-1,2-mannosyltransferase
MDRILTNIHKLLTPQRLRYPWFIGGALWMGWILSLILGKGNLDLNGHLIGTDFAAFYSAGKIILSGNHASIYDFELARQVQQALYAVPSDNFNPFLNPPFYAWLFVPFALISYPWSPLLWMVLSLIFLWLALRMLNIENPSRVFLLSLTWLPAFYVISFGQNTFVTIFIFSLVYYLWRKDHLILAGLTSGLLLFKPQLLLGLGLLWILEWRKTWRCLSGLGISSMGIVGLSLVLMPEATMYYITYIQSISTNLMNLEGFPMWNAASTQSFWLALLPNFKVLSQILYGVCAAGGLWFFIRLWKANQGNIAILFACNICLTIWLTPYLMIYDWALLIIPAVLLWNYRENLHPHLRAIYALLWVITFFSSALTFVQLRAFGFAIQIGVIVLLYAYIAIYQLLMKPQETSYAQN